jgi:hypothetical protein
MFLIGSVLGLDMSWLVYILLGAFGIFIAGIIISQLNKGKKHRSGVPLSRESGTKSRAEEPIHEEEPTLKQEPTEEDRAKKKKKNIEVLGLLGLIVLVILAAVLLF